MQGRRKESSSHRFCELKSFHQSISTRSSFQFYLCFLLYCFLVSFFINAERTVITTTTTTTTMPSIDGFSLSQLSKGIKRIGRQEKNVTFKRKIEQRKEQKEFFFPSAFIFPLSSSDINLALSSSRVRNWSIQTSSFHLSTTHRAPFSIPFTNSRLNFRLYTSTLDKQQQQQQQSKQQQRSFSSSPILSTTTSDGKCERPSVLDENGEMAKQYAFADVEGPLYKWWEEKGFFKPAPISEKNKNKKPYVVPMPPPNVTGYLHMGHAMFAA